MSGKRLSEIGKRNSGNRTSSELQIEGCGIMVDTCACVGEGFCVSEKEGCCEIVGAEVIDKLEARNVGLGGLAMET